MQPPCDPIRPYTDGLMAAAAMQDEVEGADPTAASSGINGPPVAAQEAQADQDGPRVRGHENHEAEEEGDAREEARAVTRVQKVRQQTVPLKKKNLLRMSPARPTRHLKWATRPLAILPCWKTLAKRQVRVFRSTRSFMVEDNSHGFMNGIILTN